MRWRSHDETPVPKRSRVTVTRRRLIAFSCGFAVQCAPTGWRRVARLEVRLLGSPHAAVDGRTVTTDTRKAVALLAYLAVTGRRHGRDILAGLLWPDADQEHSRSALRRTLSALGKGLGPGWLRADRESVELVGDGLGLDVSRFRELAREAALTST